MLNKPFIQLKLKYYNTIDEQGIKRVSKKQEE